MTRDTRDPDAYPKCDRCGRPNDPWPIKRPDTCSPSDWVWCIRPYPAASPTLSTALKL